MKGRIADILTEETKKGTHALAVARKLYDGYASPEGADILRKQELPQYLQTIIDYARRGNLTEKEKEQMLRAVRKAKRQAEKLAQGGAPNRALKAAYQELLEKVEHGTEKGMERAIRTAVEEKSRYVAERIARTEAARAYFEGALAEDEGNEEIFGYRYLLSSRHKLCPFDQCDVLANTDWGFGKGIYPKDKVPNLPCHPHCMCSLVPVYTWEIKEGAKFDERKAREYIDTLPSLEKKKLFGEKGKEAYEKGGDWQTLLRGFDGFGAKNLRIGEEDLKTVESGALSGALNDKNDPNGDRRRKHGDVEYTRIMKNGKSVFVDKISKNTDFSKRFVGEVYDHVFENTHILVNGEKRFDSDYDMALSFRRLMDSTYNQADIILLRHEHLERAIEKRYNTTYQEAHDLTTTKYDYDKALREEGLR